ncbi:MAG: helix-turn-helix transcriptional regulator [Clostridia bacterium]|nr:helix-turn-helix transcriptional regulator [Clostridia bacterium]
MSKAKAISANNAEKYVQLGLNIAYFRKLRGYTQEELAEMVDISRSHLSAIEAPNIIKAFSIELLFNIADALQIDSYKLLVFKE